MKATHDHDLPKPLFQLMSTRTILVPAGAYYGFVSLSLQFFFIFYFFFLGGGGGGGERKRERGGGLNGPLRHYFSLYIGPSLREREKEERNDRREKNVHCKRSRSLSYYNPN